jgi:protein phosphatase
VIVVALLGVVGAGLWFGWDYTQRQYYVGATDDGQLAVFQGVPGRIAGLDLSNVHATSPTKLDDLTDAAQEQVKQGIQAHDEPDAERRLAELTNEDPGNPNLKPLCQPSATPGPTPTPSATTPTPSAPTPTPGQTVRATATPADTPDAPPSDPIPPVTDPAGCRSIE